MLVHTYSLSVYPPFSFDYYSVGPYRLLGLISCGPHLSHGRAPFSPIQTGATTTTDQPASQPKRYWGSPGRRMYRGERRLFVPFVAKRRGQKRKLFWSGYCFLVCIYKCADRFRLIHPWKTTATGTPPHLSAPRWISYAHGVMDLEMLDGWMEIKKKSFDVWLGGRDEKVGTWLGRYSVPSAHDVHNNTQLAALYMQMLKSIAVEEAVSCAVHIK